jgi:predicted RNA-binding protein with TRAM domain
MKLRQMLFAALVTASLSLAQVPATGILTNGLRYVIQPASPPCEPGGEMLFGIAECAPREAQSTLVTIMGGDASVSGYVVTITYEDEGVVKQITRVIQRRAFSSTAALETGRVATSKLPGIRVKEITAAIVGKAETARVE